MLPVEFLKDEENEMVWISEPVYNISDIKEQVSSMMYQMGIKGTLSTINSDGESKMKIKFHSEEDRAMFLLYNSKEKKSENDES